MGRHGGPIAQLVAATAIVGAFAAGLLVSNANPLDPRDIPVLQVSPLQDGSLATAPMGQDPHWGQVAIYPVIEDGTLSPSPTGTLGDIWEVFVRVVTPAYAAEHLSAFLVANDPENPALAGVAISSLNPLRWTLAVNVAQPIYRSRFPQVLLHEYPHLLALDDSQVENTSGECATLQLPEGCLRADADLLRFHEEYWVPLGAARDAAALAKAADWRTFVDHNDQFINVQAAANVVEDFSESFVAFIVRDKPDPASGTWARKMLSFWDQPEYVAIRAHIWEWFSDDVPEPAPDLTRRPSGG